MKALRFTALGALLACAAVFGSHCEAAHEIVDAGEPADDLWGFADLHAHLAFHLAYGADLDAGGPGLMWGTPGMALDAGTVDADLAPCNTTHDSPDDVVARILLPQLAKVVGAPHGFNGYPTFDNWPLATAGLHQQMHVTWLRRAFDGGQRLMVASAVENATLAAAFSGNLTSPGNDAIHERELVVLRAQLQFIRGFVDANSDWLAIVKTSDEAGDAIRAHKMAIVLGTEVDTLSKDDIVALFNEDVRVFIPIHLADSDLGGTAVYEKMFDIHNAFVRGGVGYAIAHDDNLDYKLDLSISPLHLMGLPLPDPTHNPNDSVDPGHRNKIGLTDAGKAAIQKMIDIGAIIDVAHMSQLSIDDTLAIAEAAQVPVIDSHTAVRPQDEHAISERDLRHHDAQRIGTLGGMIGISTGGITAQVHDPTQARMFYAGPFGRLTPRAPSFTSAIKQPAPAIECKGLSVEVTTDEDDLREGSFGRIDVSAYPDPTKPEQYTTQTYELNRGVQLRKDQPPIKRRIPLPEKTLASQIDVTIHHETYDGCLQADDKWSIGKIDLSCGARAFDYTDGLKTLTGDDTITVAVSTADTSMVTKVSADVWTGDQALDSSNKLDIEVHTTGATKTCYDVLAKKGLDSKTLQRIECPLTPPIAMDTVEYVTLHKHESSSKWDVAGLTVGLDDGAASPYVFADSTYSPALVLEKESHLLTSRAVAQRMVRLTISTDVGGLEEGAEATATFQFASGPDQTIPLNRGAAITGGQLGTDNVSIDVAGSTYQFYVILDGGRLSSEIRSLRFDASSLRSDWPITRVVLEAFEEPVEHWVDDLDQVTKALSRTEGCFANGRQCGVALGTDLNGMAPGIPGTILSPYDRNRPGDFVLDYLPELGKQPVVAGRLTTGSKTWDVMSDGIAHVGLLPDFLVAAAHAPRQGAAKTVSTIFHSAGDFVRMWKKIETTSAIRLDAGSD